MMQKTTNVWNLAAPLSRAMTLCLCTFALSSCAEWPGAEPMNALTDVPVKIIFDPAGCPDPATPPQDFVVTKNSQRVVWQSVDANGNPIPVNYRIWFHPFRGVPLQSVERTGQNFSTPWHPDAPLGKYKYTIVGKGCEGKPLDPHFRVR